MDQGARQRHALLLAAGKIGGRPVMPGAKPNNLKDPCHALVPLRTSDFPDLERKADILCHRHMWPDGVGLKYNPKSTRFRLQIDALRGIKNADITNFNAAGFRRFEPGNAAKHGGLAAATRPQKRKRMAFLHRK